MQIGVESSRAVDNKRIFVIDNDEIIRAALQFMLHDENETHELNDVAAALQKSAQQGAPDVVILGNGILQQEGQALPATLKQHFPAVKLILVCDKDEAQAQQDGIDAVLSKPLTVEATRKLVDKLLGRYKSGVIPIFSA